jgi:hypothetical protein
MSSLPVSICPWLNFFTLYQNPTLIFQGPSVQCVLCMLMENPGHDHSARIYLPDIKISQTLWCVLCSSRACLRLALLPREREREKRERGGGGSGGKEGEEREMCVYLVKFSSLQGSHIHHFLLPSTRVWTHKSSFSSQREKERVCFVVSLKRLGTTKVETRC